MYDPAMYGALPISAFILAGGHSSRMGEDKALMKLGGKTLLERTLECAQDVAESVAIVGSRERYSEFGEIVEDVYADCGPLGGIHAALQASRSEINLILAVDLPGLSPEYLRFLAGAAESESQALAIVPEFDGRWHPLCAAYRRGFGAAAEAALQGKQFRIDRLFAEVPMRKISENELKSAGFGAEIFRNVNTQDELKAARNAEAPNPT